MINPAPIIAVAKMALEAALRKAPDLARQLLAGRTAARIHHRGTASVDGPGPADVLLDVEISADLAFDEQGWPGLDNESVAWRVARLDGKTIAESDPPTA